VVQAGPEYVGIRRNLGSFCRTHPNRRQREGLDCKQANNLAKSTSECGGTRAGVDERVEAMAFP
jgi:hypothetical protein